MRIAVPTLDGTNISPHFGRSPYFLVFDVANGEVVGKEQRPNTFTAHARGECSGHHHDGHAAHSHASLVEGLGDCKAVICRGIGQGAMEALNRGGIQPFVLSENCTPERAVMLFLNGKLPLASQEACGCHS